MLSAVFERFVQQSPVSVMVRGIMERVFAPSALDELFEATAQEQYTRELLFSSVVNLMSLVVCAFYPSVNAAYRAKAQEINVSRTALYDKLNRMEPGVSAALVRHTALQMSDAIWQLEAQLPPLLDGYRLRILDGTCLAATDHRIKPLRPYAAKALPGKCLVVFDPSLKLALDVFPCEDGHAQERALFEQVLATIEAGELWMADRNMCTSGFLFGVSARQADFVIREHLSLTQQVVSQLQAVGQVETGDVFEQTVGLNYQGQTMQLRRIELRLFQPTRDGEPEIGLLTSLPQSVAPATIIAELYRQRWTIETLFQTITRNFEGEIQTLAYPKAALFSFCLALVAHNILAVVRAALRNVHGMGKIEAGLSDFYLVNEIQATYRGMMIAIEPQQWHLFQTCDKADFILLLQDLATQVHLKSFLKQPRSPKKKKPPLIVDGKHRHVSTARLLNKQKISP